MNFYKFHYKGIYEIINLNLIRQVWYSEKAFNMDELYLTADFIIPVHIEFTDGTMKTYDFSYQELCRFENALHPSIS